MWGDGTAQVICDGERSDRWDVGWRSGDAIDVEVSFGHTGGVIGPSVARVTFRFKKRTEVRTLHDVPECGLCTHRIEVRNQARYEARSSMTPS